MTQQKTETCPVKMMCLARILVPLFVFVVLAPVANAHPFHICVGQMRWNDEERYWELSLRLHPQDLEQSMQRWRLAQSHAELQKGRPVEALLAGCRVEDPGFETHAIEFLNQHFFLYLPNADKESNDLGVAGESKPPSQLEQSESRSHLVWVGKEYEKAWVWLHMELHPPKQANLDGTQHLCHKILLSEIPEQENSILIERSGIPKFSLQFKGDDTAKPLKPESRSSEANRSDSAASPDDVPTDTRGIYNK